jgi:hypothetical protein
VHASLRADVPERFAQRASIPVGNGRHCVVGGVTDEDWTYSHPYVYLGGAAGRPPQWIKRLRTPQDFFGGRATHCLRSGKFIYVLLQLDTYASASLNQGIVHVVKLDLENGSVVAETPILIHEATQNYSAWVWADDGFRQEVDEIRVVGMYRYMHAYDEEGHPFSVTVKM